MNTATETNRNTNRREPIEPAILTLEEFEEECADIIDPTGRLRATGQFVVHWPAVEPDIDELIVDGDDDEPIEPRELLLGTSFCKRFVSAVVAAGATGKTALRLLQLLSLASARQLTGEHVFRRARVLFVTLEDNDEEIRRRIRAARIYHKIATEDIKGYFFRLTLGLRHGKLVAKDENGIIIPGPLAANIEQIVTKRNIDLVSFDPFVKAHDADENDNGAIDQVMRVLVDIADRLNVAVDTAHHTSKGAHNPGSSDQGRGASAMRDALRIGKTLMAMTPDEAKAFGIAERGRRLYIRYDDAKPNLAPAGDARWFKLVGVPLGNGTALYPNGDNVQTVEPWTPPDAWDGVSGFVAKGILDTIEAGLPGEERYTSHGNGKRAAWRLVVDAVPGKSDEAAKRVIKTWIETGVLTVEEYDSKESRAKAKGLRVDPAKRPS